MPSFLGFTASVLGRPFWSFSVTRALRAKDARHFPPKAKRAGTIDDVDHDWSRSLVPGWGYSAVTVAADQCHGGQQCTTVHFLRPDFSTGSFLMQNLDVTPYRGQILTYRAFVRVDPARKSVARLLVRIHRKDCTTSFRDDMGDHPIVSGDWAVYEIHAPIAMDAYHMELGMQLFGQGAAWIDQISMRVGRRKLLSAPVRAAAQENSVRSTASAPVRLKPLPSTSVGPD
jgi:hypothetical protein